MQPRSIDRQNNFSIIFTGEELAEVVGCSFWPAVSPQEVVDWMKWIGTHRRLGWHLTAVASAWRLLASQRLGQLYGSKIWSLGTENKQKLCMSEYRCFCCVDRIWRENLVSISEIRRHVLGNMVQFLEQLLNPNGLSWFGLSAHAHRMTAPLHCSSGSSNGWNMVQYGQSIIWQNGVKTLISGLTRVGTGPRDPPLGTTGKRFMVCLNVAISSLHASGILSLLYSSST